MVNATDCVSLCLIYTYRWIRKACCGCVLNSFPTVWSFLINSVTVNTCNFVPVKLDTACCVFKLADCRCYGCIFLWPPLWVVTTDSFTAFVNTANCVSLCSACDHLCIKVSCRCCICKFFPIFRRILIIYSVTIRIRYPIPTNFYSTCSVCKACDCRNSSFTTLKYNVSVFINDIKITINNLQCLICHNRIILYKLFPFSIFVNIILITIFKFAMIL